MGSSSHKQMDNEIPYHGSLVALEGPADVVATQLRLLPTSSQILILPGLGEYMPEDDEAPFSAQSYVKDVHLAVLARNEAALQFLSESSQNNKRLVFLNGGTAGAVSQCISVISEHQASGDVDKAKTIFKDLVSEGVEGLVRATEMSNHEALEKLGLRRSARDDGSRAEHNEDYAIIRAMRAADALDKETEALQIECFIRSRPRSLSLSDVHNYADSLGEPSPFFVFASAENEEASQSTRARGLGSPKGRSRGPSIASRLKIDVECVVDQTDDADKSPCPEIISPISSDSLSLPASPVRVVYGEAQAVHMPVPVSPRPIRTVRSMSDVELSLSHRRGVSIATLPLSEDGLSAPNTLDSSSRNLSVAENSQLTRHTVHLPRPKTKGPPRMTMLVSPTFGGMNSHVPPMPPAMSPRSIDQGSEAEAAGSEDEEEYEAYEELQPVLPLRENIVINFTSDTPDHIIDSVIGSFKAGQYSLSPTPDSFRTAETETCPSTPRTAELFDLTEECWGLSPVAEEPDVDYDPFCPIGKKFVRPSAPSFAAPSPPPRSHARDLMTPAMMHRRAAHEADAKFHDFYITDSQSAVDIQNRLRSLFEAYFPVLQSGGYSQFALPFLPQASGMWRPLFRNPAPHMGKSNKQAADLILAIGSKEGVGMELSSALTGQLEKLGSKPNGRSRSGRLDLRYLIANAMQSFATQSLTGSVHSSPFDDCHLLACLVIPHLETFLIINSSIRFLVLEFPEEYLPVILAMQELLGNNIFKVAAILGSDNNASTCTAAAKAASHSRPGAASPSPVAARHHASSPAAAALLSPSPTSPDYQKLTRLSPPPPRAPTPRSDLVLTSSASESEIANLITTVWKLLIDIDPFYIPDGGPQHLLTRPRTASPPRQRQSGGGGVPDDNNNNNNKAGATAAPVSRFSSAAADPARLQPPPSPRAAQGGPMLSPGRGKYAAAFAAAEEPVEVYDDEEERRLMPMYMRYEGVVRKGNSRKALKWLGLA